MLELFGAFDRERIPERVVHARGGTFVAIYAVSVVDIDRVLQPVPTATLRLRTLTLQRTTRCCKVTLAFTTFKTLSVHLHSDMLSENGLKTPITSGYSLGPLRL